MWPLKSTPRVEDPVRLRRFLQHVENADWRGSSTTSLNAAFEALNDLIYHEVLFYYRARKKQRWFSIVTRALAILFGSFGVIEGQGDAHEIMRFSAAFYAWCARC